MKKLISLSSLKWWNVDRARYEFEYANHKKRMIHEAFKKIELWGVQGSYMEFGTFQGQSIAYAYHEREKIRERNRQSTRSGVRDIFAFDSFSGIGGVTSEEATGPFRNGDYSASLQDFEKYLISRGVDLKSIQIIPGFFQNTLTKKLQTQILKKNPVAAVVNIDSDIYEPAKLALDFIKPMLVQGTVVLFDDWYSFALHPMKGEVRALREFERENQKIRFTSWKDYGPVGHAFIVTIY